MTNNEGGEKRKSLDKYFSSFAERASSLAGRPLAFVLAIVFVVAWSALGPFFHYSNGWAMVIGCVPTIITFFLVFLIQNSQNRETRAVQLKLNELIRATKGAHTIMVNLEKLTESELKVMCDEYELLAKEARERLARGQSDQHVPEISLAQELQKN